MGGNGWKFKSAVSTALHCTTLHYTALHYTTLHYTTLHYTTLHYTTLRYATLHYTALRCTALLCPTLHCTALHYTALQMPPQTPSSLLGLQPPGLQILHRDVNALNSRVTAQVLLVISDSALHRCTHPHTQRGSDSVELCHKATRLSSLV